MVYSALFHVHLNRMYILLLLDRIFCINDQSIDEMCGIEGPYYYYIPISPFRCVSKFALFIYVILCRVYKYL